MFKPLMKTLFKDDWREKYAVVLYMSNSEQMSVQSQRGNVNQALNCPIMTQN